MKFRAAEPAERDIQHILVETLRTFGPLQTRAYAGIIERGIALVASDAHCLGSVGRGSSRPECGRSISKSQRGDAVGRPIVCIV